MHESAATTTNKLREEGYDAWATKSREAQTKRQQPPTCRMCGKVALEMRGWVHTAGVLGSPACADTGEPNTPLLFALAPSTSAILIFERKLCPEVPFILLGMQRARSFHLMYDCPCLSLYPSLVVGCSHHPGLLSCRSCREKNSRSLFVAQFAITA